jgi:hypothetical protein
MSYNEYSDLLRFEKQRKSKIRFDPFVFGSFVFLIVIVFVFFLLCVITIIPVIENFNLLISMKIPNELEFYHQIVLEHNQTIYRLESKIERYIDVAEIVVNPKVLTQVVAVISNIEKITNTINVTKIENNLDEIQNDLNTIAQIIQHLIH